MFTCITTGLDLSPEILNAALWPLARPPYLHETCLPGIFAVGDVRGGSIKRVAFAVDEGSIAISFVHKVLQEYGVAKTRKQPLRLIMSTLEPGAYQETNRSDNLKHDSPYGLDGSR